MHAVKIMNTKRGRFMPFLKALASSETQIALSRIWTGVANSISNNDNQYAKHTSYDWLSEFNKFFNRSLNPTRINVTQYFFTILTIHSDTCKICKN